MPNSKSETIRARVDAELKAEAEAVLRECGLNASEAIRLFYRQVVMRRGLPFDVAIPGAATREARRDADAGRGRARREDVDDFTRAMRGD